MNQTELMLRVELRIITQHGNRPMMFMFGQLS